MSNTNLLKLLRNGSSGLPSVTVQDTKSARGESRLRYPKGGKLAPSFSHLSLMIDCQSTQSNIVDYSACASCIDIQASEKEKRINALLDQQGVNQVNFEVYLKDQYKQSSPDIRRLFQERNQQVDTSSISPNSNNLLLGKQPSLLRRRMMQSQASVSGRSDTLRLLSHNKRSQARGVPQGDQFSLQLKASSYSQDSDLDQASDFKTPVKRKSKFDDVVSDHQARSRSAAIIFSRRDSQTMKPSKFCHQGQAEGAHSDCSESSNEFEGVLNKKEGNNNIKTKKVAPLRKHTSPVFAFSILEKHQDEEQQMSNLSESLEAEEDFLGRPQSSPNQTLPETTFKATPDTSGCGEPDSLKEQSNLKSQYRAKLTVKMPSPQHRSLAPELSESPTEPNDEEPWDDEKAQEFLDA